MTKEQVKQEYEEKDIKRALGFENKLE